jgi:uncharacterized protein YaaN involved in tellurite resistance
MSDVSPLFSDIAPAATPSATPVPAPVLPDIPAPTLPGVAQPVSLTSPMASVPAERLLALPTDQDIDQLSQDSRGGYATVAEKLLATHKTADAGEMGAQINQLLATAKGLNPSEQKSLVGKVLTRIRGEREQILAHTQSVKQRIAELEKQMDQSAALQRQRIVDLEGLKQENAAHTQKLQAGLARAREWQASTAQALQLPVDTTDPQAPAKRQALQKLDQRLQITINDLQNAIVLDQQQAMELQATQDNARAILDEFDRAKNIAIPALTQLVAQQLIAIEQREAVKTDQAIRGMVNEAMLQAAQTLGQNQEQIATLQQTSMISVDTLDQCQNILEQAAQKVKAIEAQGAQQRQLDAQKRAELERRFLAMGS